MESASLFYFNPRRFCPSGALVPVSIHALPQANYLSTSAARLSLFQPTSFQGGRKAGGSSKYRRLPLAFQPYVLPGRRALAWLQRENLVQRFQHTSSPEGRRASRQRWYKSQCASRFKPLPPRKEGQLGSREWKSVEVFQPTSVQEGRRALWRTEKRAGRSPFQPTPFQEGRTT